MISWMPRKCWNRSKPGRTVHNSDELYQELRRLFSEPADAKKRGRAGREALVKHQGAAARLAELALELLETSASPQETGAMDKAV